MDLAQVPLQLSCQGELHAAFHTLLSSVDVPDVLLQMRFSHVHGQAPVVLAQFSTNGARYLFHFCLFQGDTILLTESLYKRPLHAACGEDEGAD